MNDVRAHPDDLEWLSRVMDTWFEVPGLGFRFGLNTLLDLVPGIGDAVTSLVAFGIVLGAVRRGIPRVTMVRMALNVGIYAVLGIVPFLGDVADTWWKPNMRNMALMRREAHGAGEPGRRGDTIFVAAVLGTLALVMMASVWAVFWLVGHVFWR